MAFSTCGLFIVLCSITFALPTQAFGACELTSAGAGSSAQHTIRFYNTSDEAAVVSAGGAPHVVAAACSLDLDVSTYELSTLACPRTVIAVERFHVSEDDPNDVHLRLHAAAAAGCSTSVPVRVPLFACRFGTAEAQVDAIPGAAYAWTAQGATIVSGNGTASILVSFAGAAAAVVSVTVTANGCSSSGTAIFSLRDPLAVALTVPTANVGSPARLSWSYNTTDPVLTQILQLPDEPTAIRLEPDIRTYTYIPTSEGAKAVKLTAALYRIGAKRRAARSGSGPTASSCSFVESQQAMQVRPGCSNPRAHVSGGGTGCGSAMIRADFEGVPPFRGRWSDGAGFETTERTIQRTVTANGTYTVDAFEDATCSGAATGAAVVSLAPQTRITAFTASPSAIAWDSSTTITYSYANAVSCRFTATALGNGISEAPSCSGTATKTLTYYASNAAGDEAITLEATGPCGTDQRTLRFYVCSYTAELIAAGPTTFCAGGSVALNLKIAGETAGPPYSEYRFYRCANSTSGGCQGTAESDEYSLVQRGPSSTYTATQAGVYKVTTADRLGCPNVDGGAVKVTVNACP